ncbi:MAG: penicillin-binding protein activator [Desulfobacter sp.]|nr:MAG: penicillin-binding protein activator [Desulfobacter sp.]
MMNKNYFLRLILTCLILFLAWGCAPKKALKPQGPPVAVPPETTVHPGEDNLIQVLTREAGQFAQEGHYQDALLVYNQALDAAVRQGEGAESDREMILGRIEAVLSQTPPADIQSFSRIKNLSIPEDIFLYWLGHNHAALDNDTEAKAALEEFLGKYPGHERESDIRALLGMIEGRAIKKDTLGCILPLSGKYEVYGQKALRGIQLAVRDMSRTQGRTLKVVVKDSKADPERAAACVEELARENVFAIVGPLLAPEAAGQKAQALGIPMVALTQKTDFPARGGYLFTNFITPEMQVDALGAYIFAELGLKKVAILYPRERYGRKYMELFWDVVDKYRGEVVGAESYDGRKTDFTVPLQKLTGEYYPVPEFLKVPETGETPLDGEDESTSRLSSRGSAVANEDRIEIDFQALFIPDGLSRVNLILPQLAFYDARGMVLLGTNLWHRDSLLKEARGYNRNAVICDGYFGASENPVTAMFDKSFREVFQEGPGFLEAISYDTAGLLFTGAADPVAGTREDLKTFLQDQLVYNGVTGRTRFDAAGIPHKELFLITVKRGAFKEILR